MPAGNAGVLALHLTRWRLILIALVLALPAWGLDDFTFVHLSDVHYPYLKSDSAATIAGLPQGPVELAPYNATAEAPAFAVVTGDLNEFGGGGGDWEGYLSLWQPWPKPVYHQCGNHDNTWDCTRPRIEKLYGTAFYAFEYGGAKFIGFDTATPQDPRPSIATEGLRWLVKELSKTPPEQPVFFFCHHPLNGTEFASAYARERLLEVLQTRNVVLILDGHGHGMTHRRIAGFDAVMGGSTYGPKRGYEIVSVNDGQVRVCHQFVGEQPELVAVLEKPLPARSPFLQVEGLEPADGFTMDGKPVWLSVRVKQPELVSKARWIIGEREHDLRLEQGVFRGRLPADLECGAQAVKVELTDAEGRVTSRWRRFWVSGGPLKLRWTRQLGGSCQAPLTVDGTRLYAASNDGTVQVLNRQDGCVVAKYSVGASVRAQPVRLSKDRFCIATTAGEVICLTTGGKPVWRHQTGAAVYATPVLAGDRIICANNNGDIIALNVADGKPLWRREEPGYAIESGLAVTGDTVFAGSWDGYVYAVGLSDGALKWKALSRGSDRANVGRYYSPADCAPAAQGNALFVADRAYKLSVYEALTGALLPPEGEVGAVATSSDGGFYLRHSKGQVSKRRPDGSTIWEAEVPTGYLPVPPVEADGRVWVTSDRGLLTALDAATGSILAQQRVAPGLFMFAAPAATADEVYLADETGCLMALRL